MTTSSTENSNQTAENPVSSVEMPVSSKETAVQTTENASKRQSSKGFRKEPTAKRLDIVKRGSDNLEASPELCKAMEVFGFNSDKRNFLRNLYSEAIAANSAQQKEFGEKTGAYEGFDKLYKVASLDYFNAVKVTRVALKNNKELMNILGVDQTKKQTISGLFDQMQTFFDNILENREAVQIMSGFGYTIDRLNELNKNYHVARDAYSRFYKENSEAIAATKLRDEKIDAMDEFYSDMLTIAKVALAGKKELMKLLY